MNNPEEGHPTRPTDVHARRAARHNLLESQLIKLPTPSPRSNISNHSFFIWSSFFPTNTCAAISIYIWFYNKHSSPFTDAVKGKILCTHLTWYLLNIWLSNLPVLWRLVEPPHDSAPPCPVTKGKNGVMSSNLPLSPFPCQIEPQKKKKKKTKECVCAFIIDSKHFSAHFKSKKSTQEYKTFKHGEKYLLYIKMRCTPLWAPLCVFIIIIIL